MYYKTVNRGMSLTEPGRYTLLLLFALGLIAVASGVNGIYLALSLGVSLLIISGILSEKIMRYYSLESLSETVAEPRVPFSVQFQVKNKSENLTLYGVENTVLTEMPKFSVFSKEPTGLMQSLVMTLGPKQGESVVGTCSGLGRGLYRKFIVLQKTLYPFGVISKFKLSDIETRISILPELDEKFFKVLSSEMKGYVSSQDMERHFHSHRPYAMTDSVRHVDWKKSAGKAPRQWVVKNFESLSDDFGLCIQPNWKELMSANSEVSYECQLSRIRTACEVARVFGRKLVLDLGNGLLACDYSSAVRVLVELPKFSEKKSVDFTGMGSPSIGFYKKLQVSSKDHFWGSTSELRGLG